MKIVVSAVIGIALTAGIAFVIAQSGSPDLDSAEKRFQRDAITLTAAESLNTQWEDAFDKGKRFPERQGAHFHSETAAALARIGEDSPSYAKAQAIHRKMRDRQGEIDRIETAERIKFVQNDEAGRKRFASNLDTNFLKGGRDASITTSGPKATTLTVRYVLINRPLVYELQTSGTFFNQAWDAGFKKVVLTDGFRATWNFDVPKDHVALGSK